MKLKKNGLVTCTAALLIAVLLAGGFHVPVRAEEGASADEGAPEAVMDAADQGIQESETPDDYYTRALAKRSQVFDPADAKLAVAKPAGKAKQKDCTVMVYMTGSNLESRLGSATKDLEEMENSGLSFDDVNLIAYTGGSQRWVGDVPCDRNCVLDMSKDPDDRIVAETKTNASMGASETLAEFVNFCTEFYPAEHYMLIFWDHGGGPLWGYGSDELFDADSLLLPELQTAMEQTVFANDTKLDLVGFDACLMASYENMSIWEPYADYFVASEELEPGDGWDYSFLKILNKTQDTEAVAAEIVDCFRTYYEKAKTDTFNPDITLSCIRLADLEAVDKAFADFSDRLKNDLSTGGFSSIMQQRYQTKSFGAAENAKGNVGFYYDLVDLSDLASMFSEKYPEEAECLNEAVASAVVCQSSSMNRANGISLYFPSRNKGQFSELFSSYSENSIHKTYTEFLSENAKQWLKGKTRDWTLAAPKEKGNEYTLQLTEDQMDNMTAAYYSLLIPVEENGYQLCMDRCEIRPDEDGILHIPKDVTILVVTSDTKDRVMCPVTYVEEDEERTVYKVENMRFLSDMSSVINNIDDFLFSDFSAMIAADKKTGKVTVLSLSEESGETGAGGKSSVDIEKWQGIYVYSSPRLQTEDKNGNLLPYADWTTSGTSYLNTLAIDETFSFELVSSKELQKTLYCQVGLEDTNGESYASSLCKMSGNRELTSSEADTADGKMTFAVYEDHAELHSYMGHDRTVEIPEKAGGVPVTVIQENAFSAAYDLESITIPDTVTDIGVAAFLKCTALKTVKLSAALKRIGSEAFFNCTALESLTLPPSLEIIGKNAFSYCRALKNIELPEGLSYLGTGSFMSCTALETITFAGTSKNYKTENGAVYTKDGSVLLAFPAKTTGQAVVSERTEEIAYGAFAGAAISEVALPSSLKKIGSYAFYACNQLKCPAFPDNLEQIGMFAFDTELYTYDPEDIPEEAEDIRIGGKVREIGKNAFSKYIRKNFNVDEKNAWYSVRDGALMNKAKDAACEVGMDDHHNVIIPEGTVTFDLSILEFLDNCNLFSDSSVKHIFVPESVERIEDAILYGSSNLFFHCPAGSAAEAYAMEHDIPFSHDASADYEDAEEKTEHGTLFYRIYKEYVVVTGYEGTDKVLKIPAEISGLPVLAVGDGAEPFTEYSWIDSVDTAEKLEEIELPEGLERINDHAFGELTYGKIFTIKLPSTLKEIGNEALGSSNIDSLPAGVESYGKAFANTRIEDGITLTPAVKYIAPGAFVNCSGFEAFGQTGENETYTVKDGVLFTADGTTLVANPKSAKGAYAVPEGTVAIEQSAFESCYREQVSLPSTLKEIRNRAFYNGVNLSVVTFAEGCSLDLMGEYAFSNTSLQSVDLPEMEQIGFRAFSNNDKLQQVTFKEGLKVIGENAFASTALQTLVLPDSLAIIGDYAFSQHYYREEDEPEETAGTVHFGKNLESVGTSAFSGFKVTAFDVDAENETFAVTEGFLTDKAGKVLYVIPAGLSGQVRIPDGITQIEDGAYSTDWTERKENLITDLTIPESVIFIASTGIYPLYEYDVTLHVKKDSYAQRYAIENNLAYELE